MELLRFYAGAFSRISGILGQSLVFINHGSNFSAVVPYLGANLGNLRRECEKLGLTHTLVHVNRTINFIENQPPHALLAPLAQYVAEIQQRLIDELDERTMIAIPASRVSYYLDVDLFGKEVSNRFPSATIDIMEAGKCLALNRNTASVFHLMRVMETGLRALARSLSDPRLDPTRNPSWETILKKCDDELGKPIIERSIEWRSDNSFFSTAVANLRAVKDAWRNPTMHIEQTYNDETALEVWNAVRAFMRHLATKFSEIT